MANDTELRHTMPRVSAIRATKDACVAEARLSLPPSCRTTMNTLCILGQSPVLFRWMREYSGRQRKNASHCPGPKTAYDIAAMSSAVAAAAKNIRHWPLTMRTSGNRIPSCGLYVKRPRKHPASAGLRSMRPSAPHRRIKKRQVFKFGAAAYGGLSRKHLTPGGPEVGEVGRLDATVRL